MPILDDIISSLTADYPVEEVRTCTYWTAVISRNCGLASTIRDECPATPNGKQGRQLLSEHDKPVRGVGKLTQKSAKELVQYVKSDRLLEATIGMATVNSLINVDESKGVELNAFSVIAEKGEGKNIAVIGHFPFIPKLRRIARELWVLEKRPRPGDLTEEMAPEVLGKSDVVAISATTLINHTLEGLLSCCRKDVFKVMLGPTTPMSDVMFDYGIDVISGVKVIDERMVLRCISESATFRQVKGVRLLSMTRTR